MDSVSKFNHILRQLMIDLKQKYASDPVLWRLRQRVLFLVTTDPEFLIIRCGPYLWQYQNSIKTRNKPALIQAATEVPNGAQEVVQKVVTLVLNSTPTEEKKYWQFADALIEEYTNFCKWHESKK